jgi:hypothetical protein
VVAALGRARMPRKRIVDVRRSIAYSQRQ